MLMILFSLLIVKLDLTPFEIQLGADLHQEVEKLSRKGQSEPAAEELVLSDSVQSISPTE